MKRSQNGSARKAGETPPTVDIIIAARDESAHISDCLEALTHQNYPRDRMRIMLVDDGSTDGTLEIARNFTIDILTGAGRGQAIASNQAIRAGTGSLVAFLDAHCIVDADWVGAMAAMFSDSMCGGCMSKIVYSADDVRVQAMLDRSAPVFEKSFAADTVRGKRNLYPWVIGAACMFRRAALEAVGGFSENLSACEDCDLSWRIVLLGYQLLYVPGAVANHIERRPLRRYLRKGIAYGRGSAEVAAKFRRHGASGELRAGKVIGGSLLDTVERLTYLRAFRSRTAELRREAQPAISEEAVRDALAELRPWNDWTTGVRFRISPSVLYWPIPEDEAIVVVQPSARSRFVLDGVACVMWELIVRGESRDASLIALFERFALSLETDLDEFVLDLTKSGLIEQSNASLHQEEFTRAH